jgi:LytS/YehU family sensor histidine kinase
MDPHFTFNILNSIGSLYSNTENRAMADYLFGKYAKLLRQTIVTSDQPEVTLEQELDFVKNYLDIEKFRMNNKFSYTVNMDSKVDTTVSIPRMLIHTFVENAVKYAVRQVEYHATLDISGYMDNSSLNITITDNGPGLSGEQRTEVAGTGRGLAIVDEMVRLYYDMTRIRITYTIEEIIESGKCTGTRVNLII